MTLELTATILLISVIGVIAVLLWRQQQLISLERRLEILQGQVDMFTDSSIQVARSVDQLTRRLQHANTPLSELPSQEVTAPRQVASRRWILEEACQRLDRGEEVADISLPLALSRDEVRLLSARQAGAC